MNEAKADPSATGPAGGGWTRRRWLTLVAVVFAAQVALIFVLGEKPFPSPVIATTAPQLVLADGTSELIALGDPTLFALPHAGDFAPAFWGRMPVAPPASFPRIEPVLPPLLATEDLGTMFIRFMQTNEFASPRADFKPAPRLSEPVVALLPLFAGNSSLRVAGDLMRRKLLTPVTLTNWPYADVILPSRVQVVVDADGGVLSAILLPPDNPADAASHYSDADQRALGIAQSLRFAPAAGMTVGRLIFNWRTVPLPATNSPAAAP